MAVDVFGDEDAWQWYLARIVDLLGAPGSILHDELLGSAGYPGVDEWAEIDLKREALLDSRTWTVRVGQQRPRRSAPRQPHEAAPADDQRPRRRVRPQTRRSVGLSQRSRLGPASAGRGRHRNRQRATPVSHPATDRRNEPSDARLGGEEGRALVRRRRGSRRRDGTPQAPMAFGLSHEARRTSCVQRTARLPPPRRLRGTESANGGGVRHRMARRHPGDDSSIDDGQVPSRPTRPRRAVHRSRASRSDSMQRS